MSQVDATAADVLHTVDASIGEVLEPAAVSNFPLNGRMLIDLVLTVPGAHVSHGAQAGDMNPLYWRPDQRSAVSISGNRPNANYFLLDGTTNTDPTFKTMNLSPSPDTVEEFKVQTGSYSAEMGGAGGRQINIVTRSGSNAFHGTAYDFLRGRSPTTGRSARSIRFRLASRSRHRFSAIRRTQAPCLVKIPSAPTSPASPFFGPGTHTAAEWFNPQAFATPPAFTFGDVGRNTVIGPGMQTLDLALAREFHIVERTTFQFRAEFFNALNKVNLGTPDRFVNTPQFDIITDAATPGRQIQLSARWSFE